MQSASALSSSSLDIDSNDSEEATAQSAEVEQLKHDLATAVEAEADKAEEIQSMGREQHLLIVCLICMSQVSM